MFAKSALLALMLQQIVIPFGRPPPYERARAPIAEAGPAWAATCTDDDGWEKPAPPVRIHGNTYLVGTCGISAILIVGDKGDILIDSGTQAGAELVAANIRALGFALANVRILLTSHEHFDHVGGMARLQRLTGATLVTSAPAARVVSSGIPATDDPQAGLVKPFPGASVGRVIADGETVRLGNLQLTAIATPGHTSGAISWRWESCDGGVCRTIVYADSLSPVSNKSYRFADHPAALAAFRASIAKIGSSRCEILLTPHPSAGGMRARLAAGQTLLDTNGCRAFAAARTKALDDRLAQERAR